MAAENQWVLLARLVRPQGRKGEVIADIFTDFPERFSKQPRVFLAGKSSQPREAMLERHWLHQGRIVFKFKGVDSINDAETLRGLEVVVPVEERILLKDDAVYIGDLIGCKVIDLAGETEVDVGEIEDVERGQGGAPDLLVVRPSLPVSKPGVEEAEETPSRRGKRAKKPPELLIPFAKKYLVSVDVADKRVLMRLPHGLTELNAAEEDES
jgi:16S rRNA processing protein RimM